jgi:hypothetical protein
MRIAGAFMAVVLTVPVVGQERLVPPPQLENFAKAHHCQPVSEAKGVDASSLDV